MSGSNKLTKTQIVGALAEGSGLDKKAVTGLLEALTTLIKKELGPEGPGEITIPDFVKLKAQQTPATQDREGINPFTKQPAMIKGKPASFKVKASPVGALKNLAAK